MTPEQEKTLGDYVKRALAAVAPELGLRIVRADNATLPELGSALLRIAASSVHSAELPERFLPDPDDVTKLLEFVTERGEVSAVLELRVADPPDTASSAFHVAQRVRRLLAREGILEVLTGSGLDLVRTGDVVDVSAFVRESQWESRAELTIVVSYALAEFSRVDKIAAAEITGTLTPGPLEVEINTE